MPGKHTKSNGAHARNICCVYVPCVMCVCVCAVCVPCVLCVYVLVFVCVVYGSLCGGGGGREGG